MGTLNLTGFERTRFLRAGTGGEGGGITPPTPPSLNDAIMALNPVGYWKLDEASGNAIDYGSVGLDGTYTGTVTRAAVAGGDGLNYPDFNGGYIQIADDNAWSANTGSGLTVFALIKPDLLSNDRLIASKGSAGAWEWGFYKVNPNNQHCSLWRPDGTGVAQEQAAGVLTTAWQAVAFAAPNPAPGVRTSLYRNSGTPLGSSLVQSGAGTYTNAGGPLLIGHLSSLPAGANFDGSIAHVALFAGKLSNSDVGTIMSAADAEGWF